MPVDGVVKELCKDRDGKPLEHGSKVKKGDILIRLHSSELDLQLHSIEGEVDGASKQYDSFGKHVVGITRQLPAADRMKLMGELILGQG